MADSKISNLTGYTTPLDADVLPIVDTANVTTKKVTWANIKATLKTYFDTLYAQVAGSVSQAFSVASLELGHATDTTITRTGAGAIAVEGVAVLLSGGALGTPSSGNLSNCSGYSETDPIVKAINGIVKSNGSTISAASAGTDYTSPTSTEAMSNKTLTAPKILDTGYIADDNGNEQIKFSTTASAVNEITIKNAATGNAPQIQTTGGDTDINLQLTPKGAGIIKGELKRFMVQLLSETTDQTVGTTKGGDFRISNRAITIKAVGAYCDTAGTTGTFTVDINEAGTSILSTKITVDSTEKSSETAATPPVISDSAIAADAIVTFDIDAIQTTAAKGLKVWIDYVYA